MESRAPLFEVQVDLSIIVAQITSTLRSLKSDET
jgi:hypothetical protein